MKRTLAIIGVVWVAGLLFVAAATLVVRQLDGKSDRPRATRVIREQPTPDYSSRYGGECGRYGTDC